MKTIWFVGGIVLVAVAAGVALAEVSVTEDGATVTVTSGGRPVTFDREKGGTITRIGARSVEQKDGAEGYTLASDPKAKLLVKRETPDRVRVVVRGTYTNGQERTKSGLRAEYVYTFIGGTPIVRCRAKLHQESVTPCAEVNGYPAWWEVRVLDFGDQTGWKGRFAGETKDVIVHLDARGEELFAVASDEIKKFEELMFATAPRGEHLFQESFQTSEKWTYFSGTWVAEDGGLVESSSEGELAWTVGGERGWKDYVLETQVHTADGVSIVLLCGRWQDMGNHYELQYLEWPAKAMRIVRAQEGRRITLAEVGE
ncbi:MAG: hypothetical protein V2A58_02255, partial [Planctomycetota bacterium]